MPRRSDCDLLEKIGIAFKKNPSEVITPEWVRKWVFDLCETSPLGECCRLCHGGPPECYAYEYEEKYYQCKDCKDISPPLEFLHGRMDNTIKWRQKGDKILHKHGDGMYECKEIVMNKE